MKMKQSKKLARPVLAAAACGLLVLSACGSDKEVSQLPRAAGEFVKQVSSKITSRATGKPSAAQAAAKPDPNRVVNAALKATSGPVALMVLEKNPSALTVMTPVESNAGAQTWMGASRQSITLKGGVLVGTRGLGDDMMAANAGAAQRAVRARAPSSYRREYDHLTGLGYTSKLNVSCTLSMVKKEKVAIGRINAAASVMKEDCAHSAGIAFENFYWVSGSGRILKSRQWVSQGTGYLVVQPLR